MLINTGDGLAVGVQAGATANGAVIVAWHPELGLTDQHWTVAAGSYQGTNGYLFQSGVASGTVLDLNVPAGSVDLWHSLTGTNQLWWLAASSVPGAYYIHNSMTSNCLTDNGIGVQLTVAGCVTDDKAQIWYLP